MRAHELIEEINRLDKKSFGDDLLDQSIKFDLGHSDSVLEMARLSNAEMCKPPFPITLFQFDCENDSYMVLIVDNGEGLEAVGYAFQPEIVGSYWYKENLKIKIDGYDLVTADFHIINLETNEEGDSEWHSVNSQSKTWWINRIQTVIATMEVLACTNVVYIDNPAPKSINKKREKKGKIKLFTYKTLHIVANRGGEVVKSNQTGTHASPRVHLRRGHIRRLPDGGRIWVQSCVVGSVKSGIAHKDYTASLH